MATYMEKVIAGSIAAIVSLIFLLLLRAFLSHRWEYHHRQASRPLASQLQLLDNNPNWPGLIRAIRPGSSLQSRSVRASYGCALMV